MRTDHIPQETTATICRKTGRKCAAEIAFAQHLARAANQTCAASPEFTMDGHLQQSIITDFNRFVRN